MKEFTLKQVYELIPNSKILNTENPESVRFTSVAPLNANQEQFISYLSAKSHLAEAKKTKATALIVNEEISGSISNYPLLVVDNVDIQLAKVLELIYPSPKPDGVIAETAVIHKSAKIGQGTSIGHFVVIGANSQIGEKDI